MGRTPRKGIHFNVSGNVIVTGHSYNISGNADYYTAKYAAANGTLPWERRYNGPANGDDRAVALVVDASGNVIVTGTSQNMDGYTDFYTAKYSGVNGALLCERRYSGPAGGDHVATALALDGSGNAFVTGNSWNGTNADYFTAKYAAANGALLWEQRYNGPANRGDEARAVRVDNSGNVIVTGYSDNPINSDYYTAKYAASDGALLWEKRFNGLANGDDEAVALTVDSSGGVYVTGSSENTNHDSVCITVAYDSNGNEIWVASFSGSAVGNPDSYASAIALDKARHVYITGFSGNDFATICYEQRVVAGPPIITSQPADLIVRPGTNVSFTNQESLDLLC